MKPPRYERPTDAPEPAIAELRKVLEHVTAHPEEWDQLRYATIWLEDGVTLPWWRYNDLTRVERDIHRARVAGASCQTAYCVAGHVAVTHGWQPLWKDGSSFLKQDDVDRYRYQVRVTTNEVVDDDGVPRPVADVAREVLGLTYAEAQCLFEANNDLSQLWDLAHAITGGEVTHPTLVDAASLRHVAAHGRLIRYCRTYDDAGF